MKKHHFYFLDDVGCQASAFGTPVINNGLHILCVSGDARCAFRGFVKLINHLACCARGEVIFLSLQHVFCRYFRIAIFAIVFAWPHAI